MKVNTAWELPCRSQEFNEGPKLRQESDRLVIAYDFETADGTYAWEEITFTGVVAFNFTAPRHCTEDQVAAYDKLQDVAASEWTRRVADPPLGLHHYRIFFDDIGCYEVLASAFIPPALT